MLPEGVPGVSVSHACFPRVSRGCWCSTRAPCGCSRGALDPRVLPVGAAWLPVLCVYSRGVCGGACAPSVLPWALPLSSLANAWDSSRSSPESTGLGLPPSFSKTSPFQQISPEKIVLSAMQILELPSASAPAAPALAVPAQPDLVAGPGCTVPKTCRGCGQPRLDPVLIPLGCTAASH